MTLKFNNETIKKHKSKFKKNKSRKTIRAFRPKFSLQKKIPFSDPDKVAEKLSRSFDEFNKSWKNWL